VAVAAFFIQRRHSVQIHRPIVAVIEADEAARRLLCSLLSSLDAEIQDYDSAESLSRGARDTLGCVITTCGCRHVGARAVCALALGGNCRRR
jgi:hypothetical protein